VTYPFKLGTWTAWKLAVFKVVVHTVPVKENDTLRIALAGLDFVLTELGVGATFCERALSTQDKETKVRNIRNARKA
jgi:hypothetical protein